LADQVLFCRFRAKEFLWVANSEGVPKFKMQNAKNKVIAPKPAGQSTLSVAAAHSTDPVTVPPAETPAQSSSQAAPSRLVHKPEPSFARGLVGIGVASFVSLIFWFVFTLMVGARFKWISVGLGALIGWSGHWLGREKSRRLGIAAACATALIMILGLLWSARYETFEAVNENLNRLWEERLSYAKEAAKPRTDAELQRFLAENGYVPSAEDAASDDDIFVLKVRAEGVDAKSVREFRTKELPELRRLAEGKISRSQFDREFRPAFEQIYTAGFIGRAFPFKLLGLMFVAITAAWKLCAPSR
jgi:hypothetical protein